MDGSHPVSADSDQQRSRAEDVIGTMDIHKVLSLLPHRYPFLLVDRVVDFKVDDYLIALKNVTFNEPFFTGHFPVRPVMPGVLIVEAMAQATGLLAMASRPEEVGEKSLYYFVGIDKARFKRPVEPGDQLIMEVKLGPVRRGIWKFDGEARVDDKVVATAEIMCTARDFTA
ncbi:3-hydroxyacyl-ACP dehydratase FabZ [Imhoffiella purpurea]|uniref:3-hydroxyacyl-[acyl-carrier-protein] dehydratase FabZ n=1 Tax=Imhoffiella purpurea TaxID=1249627 RepID=W9VX78_9GAMM|nr:3-hydroxyacyl-ACP dehydratase FabZ [Imhoffiella purpurea]EXJ15025.1 (3R)-hydroxymyristoyl-[acyl carrier protein] dehydratase [Imhoffiella purpurea]